MTVTTPLRISRALPFVLDLVCVVAFAFGGKNSHEADESDWIVLSIVWPFALGVVVAHLWLLLRARDTRRLWPEGVAVLVVTYVVGMLLRDVAGRGLASSFLVVAALFLMVTMLGWRAVAAVSGSRARPAAPSHFGRVGRTRTARRDRARRR